MWMYVNIIEAPFRSLSTLIGNHLLSNLEKFRSAGQPNESKQAKTFGLGL